RVLAEHPAVPRQNISLAEASEQTRELLSGFFMEMVSLLARRTAELHLALASEPDDPEFAPEATSPNYQRAVYQSLRKKARNVLHVLARQQDKLSVAIVEDA